MAFAKFNPCSSCCCSDNSLCVTVKNFIDKTTTYSGVGVLFRRFTNNPFVSPYPKIGTAPTYTGCDLLIAAGFVTDSKVVYTDANGKACYGLHCNSQSTKEDCNFATQNMSIECYIVENIPPGFLANGWDGANFLPCKIGATGNFENIADNAGCADFVINFNGNMCSGIKAEKDIYLYPSDKYFLNHGFPTGLCGTGGPFIRIENLLNGPLCKPNPRQLYLQIDTDGDLFGSVFGTGNEPFISVNSIDTLQITKKGKVSCLLNAQTQTPAGYCTNIDSFNIFMTNGANYPGYFGNIAIEGNYTTLTGWIIPSGGGSTTLQYSNGSFSNLNVDFMLNPKLVGNTLPKNSNILGFSTYTDYNRLFIGGYPNSGYVQQCGSDISLCGTGVHGIINDSTCNGFTRGITLQNTYITGNIPSPNGTWIQTGEPYYFRPIITDSSGYPAGYNPLDFNSFLIDAAFYSG